MEVYSFLQFEPRSAMPSFMQGSHKCFPSSLHYLCHKSFRARSRIPLLTLVEFISYIWCKLQHDIIIWTNSWSIHSSEYDEVFLIKIKSCHKRKASWYLSASDWKRKRRVCKRLNTVTMTVLSQNLLTREIFINPADNEQAHALINHIGNILQRSRELIPKDCLSIKNNSCVFYAAELGLNCSDDKEKILERWNVCL